jgi:two-component sensor histidine kinase
MIHDPISALRSRAEMLQVAELLHRIGNDYTRAIAFASLRAVNASSDEARSALNEVVNHLHVAAEMHRVLRPPSVAESADLTDTIARLCRAQTDVSEFRRRRIDLLLAYDGPIELDAWRCWHASLIVAELINNACRHAPGSTSGPISVGIAESDGRVLCSVSNDGAVDKTWMPGLGTQLIDALAVGLDGFVERRFGESGATAVLSFPLVGQGSKIVVIARHDGTHRPHIVTCSDNPHFLSRARTRQFPMTRSGLSVFLIANGSRNVLRSRARCTSALRRHRQLVALPTERPRGPQGASRPAIARNPRPETNGRSHE